jgi:hypothetical protein
MADNGKNKDSYNQVKDAERKITILIMLGVISLLLIVIIIGIIMHNISFY